MRKWQVRALEFTPLALTFILALTLSLVPSTRAQSSKRDQEEDCQKDQPCTPGFHVQFNRFEVYTCGEMVNLTVAEVKPDLKLDDNEQKEVLILMVDPDAPANRNCVYYLHWVASATLQAGAFTNTEDIAGYIPPSPPKGTVHRYQLLVYPRPAGQVTATGGGNFDLREFKKEYGLSEPLASFQFETGTPQ